MPGRSSLPPTFATCRQLFSMVCSRLRMHLTVEDDVEAKRVALVCMMQSFPALQKLGIHFGQGLTNAVLENIIAPTLSTGPMLLAGIVDITITASIQDVIAQEPLSILIPQCIAEGCPRLAKLTLCRLRIIQHQPQRTQPSSLPNLLQLVLDQCHIDMARDLVEQQLQAAPRLQHVKLVTNDMGAVCAFSSYISELEYVGLDWIMNKHAWAFSVLQQPCQMLRKVTALSLILHNGMIEEFLTAAPHLEQLSVSRAHIVHDWSNVLQCNWKQLSFQTVPEYASLAFLPASLQGPVQLICDRVQCIQVQASRWGVDAYKCPERLRPGVLCRVKHSPDLHVCKQQKWGDDWELQLAARAHALAQQAGGLTCVCTGTAQAVFSVWEHEPPVIQQILMHVVCMFRGLKHIVLEGNIRIDTGMLLLMGQLSQCKHLELLDGTVATCKFQDSIWPSICSLLPHVTELTLRCAQVTAQNVKVLCAAATHAMTLHVMRSAWCVDTKASCSMVEIEMLDPEFLEDGWLGEQVSEYTQD